MMINQATLSRLLAVIHQDDGQYENEHGTEEAVGEAVNVVLSDRDQDRHDVSKTTDFTEYQHSKTRVKAARFDCERASLNFDLEQVHCRLAEIKSQAEPLNTLYSPVKNSLARSSLYAAAFYVVVGRMPEQFHEHQ